MKVPQSLTDALAERDAIIADMNQRAAVIAAAMAADKAEIVRLREALAMIRDRDLLEIAFQHTREWIIPETGSAYKTTDPVFKRSAFQSAQDFQIIARQALETPHAG